MMNGLQLTLNQRDGLLAEIDRELAASRDKGTRLALLVFNLSGFRAINANYGHAAGDTVLSLVWQRVSSVLRPCDRIYHIGNDEFAVLITALRTPQVASFAAQKILSCVDTDYKIAADVLAVSAIAGSAIFPDQATDRDGLLRCADRALHLAREQGRTFLVYDGTPVCAKQQPAKLMGDLRKAFEDNTLTSTTSHRSIYEAGA
jgi:diguanylate cyclase (GGDEF)-like protein